MNAELFFWSAGLQLEGLFPHAKQPKKQKTPKGSWNYCALKTSMLQFFIMPSCTPRCQVYAEELYCIRHESWRGIRYHLQCPQWSWPLTFSGWNVFTSMCTTQKRHLWSTVIQLHPSSPACKRCSALQQWSLFSVIPPLWVWFSLILTNQLSVRCPSQRRLTTGGWLFHSINTCLYSNININGHMSQQKQLC